MKTELKVKFLQHLNQKKQDEGFTLIELLMIIFILGILSAIALPSFLSQAAKAKRVEAKQIIGLVNRAQMVYRTENNLFATTFDALVLSPIHGGSNVSTKNYSYAIAGNTDTATITATALDNSLKAYSGGNSSNTLVFTNTSISSIICEAKNPGTTAALAPYLSNTADPICDINYKSLSN